MHQLRVQKYSSARIREVIMGPNPIKLLEQLLTRQTLQKGSRVLDLGCGKGITSVFMAREYGFRVTAADLWISPTENFQRFTKLGISPEEIFPIRAEAHDLPFAENFFDAVVSIDAYHYFGRDKEYMPKHLLPLVKPGGWILLAVPGLKQNFHGQYPPELLLSWTPEDLDTMPDMDYWKALMDIPGMKIRWIGEMDQFEECWQDWLNTDNPHAVGDRKSMEAGAGKYMNFIGMILQKKVDIQ